MRRGLLTLVVLAALALAPAGQAASWARPQIETVVERGLMGPSVSGFRPEDALTRRELGEALAALTGQPQVVVDPERPVKMTRLHAALVRALGLRPAAKRFRAGVAAAGLRPPKRLGNEVVARLLRLRHNHPAGRDDRERRPHDPATRAEAAYSLARVLELSGWDLQSLADRAAAFSLPALTTWKTRVLKRAVRFVGYPYVWGGTSEFTQTLFGVTSRGGFDCSGFVWRVYKLQRFKGAPSLGTTLVGRTTYEMSGEFPRRKRVSLARLKPADLVFFGSDGPRSAPSEVDHMGIYLGNGWFVHSSSQGTTLAPLTGWYADRFAWGRRPLSEVGLS